MFLVMSVLVMLRNAISFLLRRYTVVKHLCDLMDESQTQIYIKRALKAQKWICIYEVGGQFIINAKSI